MDVRATMETTIRNVHWYRGSGILALCACMAAQALPPIADGGPAQIIPVLGGGTSAECQLDASRSYDPDGTISTYSWRYQDEVYSTSVTTSAILPLGVHPFWLIVRDNSASVGTDLVVVSVCRGVLDETFQTNALDGWETAAGAWAVEDGALVQTGDVASGFIWYNGTGATAWANYTMGVTLTPDATGTVGCALYCKDADTRYQFAIGGASNLTFSCVTNGVAMQLASAVRPFSTTQSYLFIIAVTNGRFNVSLNANQNNLFNMTVTNTLITGGSVGLLAGGGAQGMFDRVFAVMRQRPVRVVPLGDSISHGRGTLPYTFSWRYPLHRMCVEEDFQVDMIGTLSTGFNGNPPWTNFHGWAFDRNHQATWGITAHNVSNQLDTWMKQYEAPGDVLLILLGTNGSGESNAIPRAVDSHRRMIEIARRHKPHVVTIIGLAFQEWAPFPAMRAAYRDLATDMNRSWSPVVTIDHSPGWISRPETVGSHTVDWVHPNPTGDHRLAWIWRWPLTQWAQHALHNPGTPQSPTVLINNGDQYTENPTVTVTLAAANPAPDCMQVSESWVFAKGLWETYTNTCTMILSPALGTKTVYARFNAGGPTTATVSDSIELTPEPAVATAAVFAAALMLRRQNASR
ncbi:hypothetical protein GX586_09310 [bacterium]|nr:hypothetical protein [bacterium]